MWLFFICNLCRGDFVTKVTNSTCNFLFPRGFDTSKQAVGAMLVHFANIFLAGLFKGDPCTWYVKFSFYSHYFEWLGAKTA